MRRFAAGAVSAEEEEDEEELEHESDVSTSSWSSSFGVSRATPPRKHVLQTTSTAFSGGMIEPQTSKSR